MKPVENTDLETWIGKEAFGLGCEISTILARDNREVCLQKIMTSIHKWHERKKLNKRIKTVKERHEEWYQEVLAVLHKQFPDAVHDGRSLNFPNTIISIIVTCGAESWMYDDIIRVYNGLDGIGRRTYKDFTVDFNAEVEPIIKDVIEYVNAFFKG
jgi:hypothetical protein